MGRSARGTPRRTDVAAARDGLSTNWAEKLKVYTGKLKDYTEKLKVYTEKLKDYAALFSGKCFDCRAIRVETSSNFGFFAVFLQKKRKISGRKLGAIEEKYAGLRKAPGKYLALFYQFRNYGCASESCRFLRLEVRHG
jgi:hypothetical protein